MMVRRKGFALRFANVRSLIKINEEAFKFRRDVFVRFKEEVRLLGSEKEGGKVGKRGNS